MSRMKGVYFYQLLYRDMPFVGFLLHDRDAFACVEAQLLTLELVESPTEVLQDTEMTTDEKVSLLSMGRDAAQTIVTLAYAHGYSRVAGSFNRVYDRFCRALLNYCPEVA
jgi:hypothetical protein